MVTVISENLTVHRTDSGVLSGLYMYFVSAETPQQRGPSADEQEATRRAQDCIQECHVEQLIMESKFLRVESLQELLKVCRYCWQLALGIASSIMVSLTMCGANKGLVCQPSSGFMSHLFCRWCYTAPKRGP